MRHALLAIALALAVACARSSAPPPRPPLAPRVAATASNILRGDYVGSGACKGCHAREYAAWGSSPMHRMTRDASPADVRAPFDGRALRVQGDTVALQSSGGERFVRILREGGGSELYRVTRVIGGRTREDFVGVRVRDPGDVRPLSEERVLPVSYLIFSGRLRYKGYSVLVRERSSAQSGPVWSATCLFCHNTVPFFSTIAGALAGPQAPAYQGEDVDPLLPEDRRWAWGVGDPGALRAAVDDELDHLHAPRGNGSDASRLRALIDATRAGFGAADLVEIGIGCESCHNGARAHLDDPSTPPSFVPQGALLRVTPTAAKSDAAARAQAIDRVCARCHQVLFSQYPWTWEGGRRRGMDRGGSPINSGEGRDFLLGGCASALACTACHDPHDGKPIAHGNDVCTSCHAPYADPARLRAHAHHDPNGRGGACVACHMPRKNLGLDLTLTPYHRIGSPTDPARVLRDRPLECAGCHADKSVAALVGAMESWWKRAYPRDLLLGLYGDLDARPLEATMARGKPHEVAVAAAMLGEARDPNEAPAIARGLASDYPLVRMVAARALDEALGAPCGLDVNGGSVAEVERAASACLRAHGGSPPSWPAPAATATLRAGAEAPSED